MYKVRSKKMLCAEYADSLYSKNMENTNTKEIE